jgi:hypothetical protein
MSHPDDARFYQLVLDCTDIHLLPSLRLQPLIGSRKLKERIMRKASTCGIKIRTDVCVAEETRGLEELLTSISVITIIGCLPRTSKARIKHDSSNP